MILALRYPVLPATMASAAMLAFAYVSQYGFGYAPCALCYSQRYAHFAVLAAGAVALMVGGWARLLVPAALAASTGLALFHAGVEQQWWEGPATCTATLDLSGTLEEALAALKAAPITRCDEIAWAFLGLSMAAWNALLSATLAVLTLWLLRRTRNEQI